MKNFQNNKKCKHCDFFVNDRCRFNPPPFPATNESAWCGQWQSTRFENKEVTVKKGKS